MTERKLICTVERHRRGDYYLMCAWEGQEPQRVDLPRFRTVTLEMIDEMILEEFGLHKRRSQRRQPDGYKEGDSFTYFG